MVVGVKNIENAHEDFDEEIEVIIQSAEDMFLQECKLKQREQQQLSNERKEKYEDYKRELASSVVTGKVEEEEKQK